MQVVNYSHATKIIRIGPRRYTAFDNDKVRKYVTVPCSGELDLGETMRCGLKREDRNIMLVLEVWLEKGRLRQAQAC